jgi:hypothetical protein
MGTRRRHRKTRRLKRRSRKLRMSMNKNMKELRKVSAEVNILNKDYDIKQGDILVFENFRGPKFLKYQHSEIALNDSQPVIFRGSDDRGIQLSTASCGAMGCQEVHNNIFEISNKKKKTKIHVIRYTGTDSKHLRMLAGNIANNWTFETQIKYPSIFESITSAFPRAGIMPCYKRKGDRKSGQKYIDGAINEVVPIRKGGENVKMFCSKFVMGVWFSALGRRLGWDGIDNCIPIKPSNCSPSDVFKLPRKRPRCWKLVSTIDIVN